MTRYAKTMSEALAQVREGAKKITKKERDSLENDNQHGELALKLAQSFGTPQEVKKIKDINKRHMQKGSIDPKDQKERDAISNKYYKMAEGYEIGTKEYTDHTKKITPGEVDEAKYQVNYSKNNKLYSKTINAKDEDDAEEKAIKKFKIDNDDIRSVVKEEVELDENYRKLAMKGIGTETKKGARVGLKTDYYLPSNGDKSFGKITRVSSSGYEITDEKTKKVHKFKFYDPNNDPTSVRGTREEVELDVVKESLDEGFSPKEIKMAIGIASDPRYAKGNYDGAVKQIEKIKKGLSTHKQVAAVLKRQNENLDEKYDLYHKSFSDAMQHAYDYAKKKMGITVDPKEIDSKVATGPKKPSEGKTNTYRLKGKGGNLQIQVYNKGGSKPFELNMYKEELELDEGKIKQVQSYIDDIVNAMKKDKLMKPFADKFKKDALKTLDPEKSLEKILPDYIAGKDIAKLLNMGEGVNEMFDYVLLDRENKIVGRYSGKDAKKNAEMGKKSAHLPPMRIPKGEVSKMKVYPISPKDKKGIGDMVLAIGEEKMKNEGMWSMASTPKEVSALKKLMQRPIPVGDPEKEIYTKEMDALYGLLGDDELFDMIGELGDKKGAKADARPVIMKWFAQRIKDNYGGYGERTKELAKAIGLKKIAAAYEENKMTEKLTSGNLSLKETVIKMWQDAVKLDEATINLGDHDGTDKDFKNLVKKMKLKITTAGDGAQGDVDTVVSGDPKNIEKMLNTMYGSDWKSMYKLKGNKYVEEAVSPAQQAAIAISKKERGEKPKKERDEGNAFGAALKAAKDNGEDTFVVAGKTYRCEDYDDNGEIKEFIKADGTRRRVKEGDKRRKENANTPKIVEDSDDDKPGTQGDADEYQKKRKAVAKKFGVTSCSQLSGDKKKACYTALDKAHVADHEEQLELEKMMKEENGIQRYFETKKDSLRDSILNMWKPQTEKNEKDEKDEEKGLTKKEKNDTMTDTGKKITPVEISPKMAKIKNEKNRV